jgi:hypothetical protein
MAPAFVADRKAALSGVQPVENLEVDSERSRRRISTGAIGSVVRVPRLRGVFNWLRWSWWILFTRTKPTLAGLIPPDIRKQMEAIRQVVESRAAPPVALNERLARGTQQSS